MERLLQFGTGRFLRGFVEAFIDDDEHTRAARGGPPARRVTVVETMGSGMAARLAAGGFAYELRTRGLDSGAVVDTHRTIKVIDRSVDASERLDSLVAAALDPGLTSIVSNTTEAGYAPGAYPRHLAAVLVARARAGLPGLTILPCELVDRNGERLRDLVMAEPAVLGSAAAAVAHVRETNAWGVTHVDRIVTAPPPSPGADHDTDGPDPSLTVIVEPFASWIVEAPGEVPLLEHPSVIRTSDVTPYALRKIRILNGAHTALVAKTRGSQHRFVREALADDDIRDWLEGLMLEEIVPALGERISDGAPFAASVLERFRNPFLDHRLADIAINHDQKLRLRLVPTYHDHVRVRGRPPERLGRLLREEGVLA